MPAFLIPVFQFIASSGFVTFIASLFGVSVLSLLKSLGVGFVTFTISITVLNTIEAIAYSHLDDLTTVHSLVLYMIDAVNLDLAISIIFTAISFKISLGFFSRSTFTARNYNQL